MGGPLESVRHAQHREQLVRLLAKSSALDEPTKEEILRLFDGNEEPGEAATGGVDPFHVSLLEEAGDAIFVHDVDGTILNINPVACRRLGYSKEELIGRFVYELSESSTPELYAQQQQRLLLRKTYAYETTHQNRDGHSQPVEINARLVEYRGRQAVLSIARDLTARKIAESIMLEQKQFLTAVLEHLPLGLFVKKANQDYSYLLWNAKMEELTGLKRGEVLGQTDKEMFPQEQAALYRKIDEQVMSEGQIMDISVEAVSTDRCKFKAHTIKVPLYDEAGKPEALLGIVEDITARIHAEEQLRHAKDELEQRVEERTNELQLAHDKLKETEEHYRALYEQAAEGIFVLDEEGNFLHANPAALEIFGYQEQELRTMHPMELLHPNEVANAPGALKGVRKGAIVQLELQVRKKDGGFADVTMGVKAIGKNHILATMWDISERKHMERELRDARDVAEKASEAKSEFLANMSHEIRTPMGGILGMTDMVLSMALEEEQREYLKGIKTASLALLDIINDILDFSKIEAKKMELKPAPFSLRERMDSLHDTFFLDAERKGLSLHISVDDQVPDSLLGDSGRMGQILANLLSNSIKFTEHGSVRLNVSLHPDQGELSRLSFAVEDTGIGIPNDKREQLFEVFSQLDPSLTKRQQGTGLGLAISRRLVEMMGGGIDLESEEGKGSRFYFDLSFEQLEGAHCLSVGNGTHAVVSARGVRVLLAEDNLLNQEFLSHFLEEAGHHVCVAENGVEVLSLLATSTFDIVLMDIQMPEMDGIQATEQIRAQNSKIPIVALTAYAMKGDRERMLKVGMNGYLSKPVDMEKLFSLIDELTEGGSG